MYILYSFLNVQTIFCSLSNNSDQCLTVSTTYVVDVADDMVTRSRCSLMMQYELDCRSNRSST